MRFCEFLFYPLAKPIACVLDRWLGVEEDLAPKAAELKAIVALSEEMEEKNGMVSLIVTIDEELLRRAEAPLQPDVGAE